MAAPQQAAALGGPAEPAPEVGGRPDDDGRDDRKSTRDKLRKTLTRRRATGVSRLAMRNWRIRTRLIALLTLPVLVALVLGGLRIQTSLEASQQLAQMANLSDLAKKATNLADALQNERDVSAGPITHDPNAPLDDDIVNARKITDDLNRTFTASSDKFENLELSGGKALLFQIRRDLNSISDARGNPYQNNQNIQATITAYDVIIRDLLAISQDIALASNNRDLVRATRALQQFSLAKNVTSQQRALISAALANPKSPDLSLSDESFGIRLRTSYDNALTGFNNIYTSHDLDNLRGQLSYNNVVADADRYARSILQQSGIHQTEPVSYKDWYEKITAKITAERRIEAKLIEDLDGKAQDLQAAADTEALITGAAVALVLLVALGGAAVIARSMVRSLTRLQAAAEDVAERRLPELVKTLSESDPHDVDVTVEPVAVDSTDEIGHVAHAFDMVHSEAVRLAAEQALLRGNINAMFTNLSRRSQGLIQRQLSLISELESREADPDQLANLFKLDHLATRMRRNGENLLVLAGEDPGRRWTRPVPLVDVLRAAASEVEQYERIELASVPSAEVAGRVVNDLVHLLAELLENATSFSSPQTRVRVTGHALPDGRVLVEIHDTGIGLSPDDLADINERLANPPTVDVSVSRRMGLFVVGRLSLRHGIRIQLRPSDSGGTTALVMLPVDVTNSADRRAPGRPGPAQAKQQRGAAPTPRQQRQMPGGPGGGPAALGQGPAGGAPQGRPQLGQGGPGAPGGPGAGQGGRNGGLPTRQVGKALRENPMVPPGRAPQQNQQQNQQQGPQQNQQGGLPQRAPGRQGPPQGGPGAPGAPGGLPRRGQQQPGAPQPGPGPRTGEQPQHGWADQSGRPGAPQGARPGNRPQDGLPQRGRPGQAPQGPGGQGPGGQGPQGPQGPRRPQRPGPQQGRPQQLPAQQAHQAPPQQAQPQQAQPPQLPAQQAQPQPLPAAESAMESTAQFARPRFEASEIDPRDPLGLGLVEPVLPDVPNPARPEPVRQEPVRQEPMALPTGPSQGGAPGFESPEQTRPQLQQGHPAEAAQGRGPQYQPRRPGTSAPGFQEPQTPQAQHAQAQHAQAQQAQAQAQAHAQQAQAQQAQAQAQAHAQQAQAQQGPAGEAPWRPSANDERWRRAEQVREPSTSGVTMSGLPRRTPQANLVSGTAEASPMTGPQVSRAPEEVRGRLTNLRRGIQQGRRAGAEQASGQGNPGSHHGAQQPGFDSFGGRTDGNGADHQER
ncbi:nitrate- and nitrite sensing domain-containing protein [Kitasatospora sp. CM 4170]|uniref:histidine kinase n=1 Tax=Kitasatospora aburaviensis TaxID=67265 RepID=A0ABW1F0H7_9ACTN|nr:nitrate- and nitrite sensing domain-containing protein [Kitasatospora sp. CM 4170]WNM47810.1 nitrate- and nitrite sensing domain-containing protein [Kitasatospora sp. CM 4170]